MSKLFVYGVNASCPRETLEAEFGRCGEVTDVYITGKGYAFVTMADDAGASAAVKELNGMVIDGQEVKVDNARSGGENRSGGGGYGGGRSFGRGGGGGFGGGRGGGFRGGDRGGRGGFGGGGRGGGRGCYNCGQDGHIARECPEQQGGGGGHHGGGGNDWGRRDY